MTLADGMLKGGDDRGAHRAARGVFRGAEVSRTLVTCPRSSGYAVDRNIGGSGYTVVTRMADAQTFQTIFKH